MTQFFAALIQYLTLSQSALSLKRTELYFRKSAPTHPVCSMSASIITIAKMCYKPEIGEGGDVGPVCYPACVGPSGSTAVSRFVDDRAQSYCLS